MPLENNTPKRFTATNDITGNLIKTQPVSDAYMQNYDAIFRKDKKEVEVIDNADEGI